MAKGTSNRLIFKDAELARDTITATQKREIAKLYEDWADDIGKKAEYYSHKSTSSAPLSERYYKELQKQLREASQQVSNEVYKTIKQSVYTVADAVVKSNVDWLSSLGFSSDGLNGAFSSVPDSVVRKLVTGQIYDSGWSLSSRIWSDNEDTLKDIYKIVAQGVAQNKPIYDIVKSLESYVRPGVKKPWNLTAPDGVKIYKKQVDYNAQRLARTLVQHGYQQGFIETTKDNPFITEYIWRSNGSRVCELCMSRDGKHYKKNELPMDHPNGMCTMIPVVADDMNDQLANWFNSPDGTYPEIDAFAENFGYNPYNAYNNGLANIKSPKRFSVNQFQGGSGDFEISQDVLDLHLTDTARGRIEKLTQSIRTPEELEKYLNKRGISLTSSSKALLSRWGDEIPAVKQQIDYVIASIEQYDELGGIRGIKAVHIWEIDLDVQGQYCYRAIGEEFVKDEGHIYLSDRMTGFQAMHEFAHAYADSTKPSNMDVVGWSAWLNDKGGLSKDFKAYFGANSDVIEAEKFADAIGSALAYGKSDKLEFLSKVANLILSHKKP